MNYQTILLPYPKMAHNSYFYSGKLLYGDEQTIELAEISFYTNYKDDFKDIIRQGIKQINKFCEPTDCGYSRVSDNLFMRNTRASLQKLLTAIEERRFVVCPEVVLEKINAQYGTNFRACDVIFFEEKFFD